MQNVPLKCKGDCQHPMIILILDLENVKNPYDQHQEQHTMNILDNSYKYSDMWWKWYVSMERNGVN